MKEDIKWLFKQRIRTKVNPGEWNRWYATIREEEISVIDDDVIDTIASKMVDMLETFKLWWEPAQEVYSNIANWFSVIASTPQAANILKEEWLDFYYTILSSSILNDKKVWTKYVQAMDKYINDAIKKYDNIYKTSGTNYKYNGNVWNLKAGILQIQEWIAEANALIQNNNLLDIFPWIKEQVQSRLNFITKDVFDSKDFEEWLDIVSKWWLKDYSKLFKETYNVKSLDDNSIDEICKYLAYAELEKTGITSKKFYDTLYEWYKKWFDVAKTLPWDYKFKLTQWWFSNEFKSNTSLFWVIDTAFVLGNLDNKALSFDEIIEISEYPTKLERHRFWQQEYSC